MKRLLFGIALAFALGLVVGVLLVLGPHPLTDSPWPAPTPSPTPTPILAIVDEQKVDRMTCEAWMAGAVIAERLRLTGKPNPPPESSR